jgi:NADH-quinone oxidoreductase subunit A
MLGDYFPFLIYGFSFIFATRPRQRVRARFLPFESGVSQGPPDRQRFTVSFYLTAMLFILFDIEIVFLYPLAIVLERLGWFGLVEFLVFIAILAVAYVYIWRKGALEWH